MMVGRESDESLMIRVAQGQAESLTPLVHRYANPLLTFIARMIGDRHDSEEIFQEVFLLVWRKRRTFRMSNRFRPWLYQIARNACRAHWRRGRVLSLVGVTGDWPTDAAGQPSEPLLDRERDLQVADAVGRLPERQRVVVVMRIWCGLTYAEIADALRLRQGTVRAHMHQALAHLRCELTPLIGATEVPTLEVDHD